MIKNILSVLIILFSFSFFYLVGITYFSDIQEIKINKNRQLIHQKIKDNISGLPILVDDTNNVIKFNPGFKNEINKVERNFWKLFKKND
jgi:hypothetical protein|tara:strand:- start:118 stop:384 length:267 start_codon:yes stop_codon:yes gene_type:complete